MSRDRACAALIIGSEILMVQHSDAGRVFWTLPGGGIEGDETPEDCASRELFEETGVRAFAIEQLWKHPIEDEPPFGVEYCFLMKLDSLEESNRILLGIDPEQATVPPALRTLQDVSWKSLLDMQSDVQVAAVLKALR